MILEKLSGINLEKLGFSIYILKIIVIVLAILMFVVSQYACIFFIAAMLPSLLTSLIDRGEFPFLFAIVCIFNFMGIVPFLQQLWSSPLVSETAKILISEIKTWIVVYGACVLGQVLYIIMPILVSKIYMLQVKLNIEKLMKKKKKMIFDWNIESNNV